MKRIFSRFLAEGNVNRSLSEIAQNLAAFSFDMRSLHLNVTGNDFLSMHEYAQEMYEEAEEWYDKFAEMAISFGEKVTSMNVLPGDWTSVEPNPVSSMDCANAMLSCVHTLYDRLEAFDGDKYSTFVSSERDSALEWLDKANYKLTQMTL